MIIKDEEAIARLSSPMNLINQMKTANNSTRENSRSSAMSLFGLSKNKSQQIIRTAAQTEMATEIKTESPITVMNSPEVEEVHISFNPFEKQHVSSVNIDSNREQTETKDPSIDDLLSNSDQQIQLAVAHDNALSVLTNAVKILGIKLDDVDASKLPAVITATSKVVESIRRERHEQTKAGKDKEVHYHFYTPIQRKVEDYGTVIEVS